MSTFLLRQVLVKGKFILRNVYLAFPDHLDFIFFSLVLILKNIPENLP